MIYLITGEDKFLIDKKVDEIVKDFKISQLDVLKYDGNSNKFNISYVLDECNSYSLFNDKKLVLVFNPLFFYEGLSQSEENNFIEFCKNDSDEYLLIFYGDIKIDKKRKFNKDILKFIKVHEIKKIDQNEFNNYLRSKIKKNNIDIDENAIQELIDFLPLDLEIMNNEVNKLILYKEKITPLVISKLISRKNEDDIFELINALSEKKLKKSLKIWNDFKIQNIDALSIILILATQIRFLYQVKYLKNKAMDNKSIAEALNTKEGRIHYSLMKVNKYTINDLLYILNMLAKLDQSIKSGLIDADNGFELFVLEMMR